MQTRFAIRVAILLALGVIGCQAGPSGAPPGGSGGPDGPEALVADLRAAGADARLGDRFTADPFAAQGVVLCVHREAIRLYVFPSERDRITAAARIDPKDPSNLGTAIVDWIGRPRLWQRDRVLVLYLGEDAATEAALRGVLGEPFASGQGSGQIMPEKTCG